MIDYTNVYIISEYFVGGKLFDSRLLSNYTHSI